MNKERGFHILLWRSSKTETEEKRLFRISDCIFAAQTPWNDILGNDTRKRKTALSGTFSVDGLLTVTEF